MTSAERINLALHHKEADRIAIHDAGNGQASARDNQCRSDSRATCS